MTVPASEVAPTSLGNYPEKEEEHMNNSSYLYGGTDQEPAPRKMSELILLMAFASEGDKTFGATKLNKLLFYADSLHFQRYGQSITGYAYRKLPFGPAPEGFTEIRNKLEEDGDAVRSERNYFGKQQSVLLAVREPDISVFTTAELRSAIDAIELLGDMNGSEVSDKSHALVGWYVAGDKERIPYSAFLLERRQPTFAEAAYGIELDRRFRQQEVHTDSH